MTKSTTAPIGDIQVPDDSVLLDLMMSDLRAAPSAYQPGSYWKYYEPKVVDELKRVGLRDFRRRGDSIAQAFGTVEVRPLPHTLNLDAVRLLSNKYSRRIPGWRNFLQAVGAHLSSMLFRMPHVSAYDASLYDLQLLTYEFVRSAGRERGAGPIDSIESSRHGNPEDTFRVDGRLYSMAFLKYYWRYTFAAQFVDFSKAKVFVELGSGAGMQAEVFKKLHPNLVIALFDLPPQLYVAAQYLSSVFPGDVVSYPENRGRTDLSSLEPGKIYIFGNWQFPLLTGQNFDIFWNARSLGETEPEIVATYLSTVAQSFRHIYLNQILGGQTLLDGQAGPGVRRRTEWADYETLLCPTHDIVGRKPSLLPSSPSSTLREYNSYADEAVWTLK